MIERSILVAGQDIEYALGRLCTRGFEALGHNVTYFDTRTKTVPLLGISYGETDMRNRFVDAVTQKEFDVVFVIKGEGLSTETLERVRNRTDAVLCNWNPDNPFKARSQERRLETYLETLPLYDIAFIWTKSLFDRLHDAGARNVYHLPFAYDPSFHHPVDSDPEYQSDVVFAGHWSEKRQNFLSAVAELDVNLAIYGNYWKRKCFDRQLRQHIRDSAVFGKDYCKALCSSKIAINIVADHNLDAYNMRSFEIPATGSFMATTRTNGQQEIFGEGEGMACFETPEELKETVMEYLASDEREKIAETGAERVEHHTYENRMETVIETVKEVR